MGLFGELQDRSSAGISSQMPDSGNWLALGFELLSPLVALHAWWNQDLV